MAVKKTICIHPLMYNTGRVRHTTSAHIHLNFSQGICLIVPLTYFAIRVLFN
jgi:hypothetical protein